MVDVKLNQDQLNVLARARMTYGDTAQILVSNEELCELAAVCAKFPRYESPNKAREELYDKAVDGWLTSSSSLTTSSTSLV